MVFSVVTVRVFGAALAVFKFTSSDKVIYGHIKVIGQSYEHRNIGASLAVFVI